MRVNGILHRFFGARVAGVFDAFIGGEYKYQLAMLLISVSLAIMCYLIARFIVGMLGPTKVTEKDILKTTTTFTRADRPVTRSQTRARAAQATNET